MARASEESRRIYIGNLPYTFTTEDLRAALAALGLAPTDVHAMVDKETGRGRGFGFAEFATAQGATEAVGAVSGASMGGRVVRSEIAAPRPAGSGGSGRRDDRRRDDHRRRD